MTGLYSSGPKTVTVNWGDGTSSSLQIPAGSGAYGRPLSHVYPRPPAGRVWVWWRGTVHDSFTGKTGGFTAGQYDPPSVDIR